MAQMGKKRHGRPKKEKKIRIQTGRPKSLLRQDLPPIVSRIQRLSEVHPTGFEPVTFGSVDRREAQETQGKTGISETAGANAGALETKPAHIAPDLQAIIDAWPTLPEAIRTGILAMIRASANS